MLIHFWTIVFLFSIFLGLIVASLLAVPVNNRKHSNSILAIYVGCFVLFSTHNFLQQEGMLLRFPFLFRFTKPLHYIVGPLVFLYVRSVVFNEVHFRKWDWLFLVLPVLHTVELLPFFMMDIERKKALIMHFMENMNRGLSHNEGILPPFFHPVFLGIYNGVMLAASHRFLRKARSSMNSEPNSQNLVQFRWLKFFTGANTIIWAVLLLHMMTFQVLPVNTFLLNNVEAALLLIAIVIALFFYPNILYGFQDAGSGDVGDNNEDTDKAFAISPDKKQEYLSRIKECFEQKQVYLQQGYTIRMLSDETKIPYTYLSQVVNQEFAMNFNELVNSYRVEYVKKLLLQPEAQQYTFEALAEKAGFRSRATFSRAFHRFAGCTPTEYLRKSTEGSH